MGDTEGRYPTDQGFDEWNGIPRSSDRAFWPDSNSFTAGSHPDAVFTHVMSSFKGQKPIEHEVFVRTKANFCTIDSPKSYQSSFNPSSLKEESGKSFSKLLKAIIADL